MSFARLSLLFFLAGALSSTPPAASAQESAASSPRAGAWQVLSGAPGQPMAGYTVCLRNGAEDLQLLLPRLQGAPECGAPSMRYEGSELRWELSCPARSLSAQARYTLAAESIEGRIRIISGQPPQQREETLSARYAGACGRP